MIKALLQSFDPVRPGWDYQFGAPLAVHAARSLAAVVPVLRWAEEQARQRWVVVSIAYEAAPALDRTLATHSSGPLPLVWAAAFKRPSRVRPVRGPVPASRPWSAGLSYPDYARAIKKIKTLIARGHTYQVNFTFPLRRGFRGDARAWFDRLGRTQGAPYSAYLDFGRWKILSFSPEIFFSRRGNRLTLRPMKGSAPRGRWPAEDEARARTLARSAKDRAENLMIVDLLRSDAGKIARPGGVRTKRLFEVERYPTVHQMTSTLEARLSPGTGLVEILRALFPSGSVTGAPKRRTMEIIRSLEPGRRGLYTGAIGLLKPRSDWTFNVAIRTVTLDARAGRAVCPVGGGVTWASSARAERDEALLKGKFLSAPDFDLVETLRLENGRFSLRGGHRERLLRSADFFGFRRNPAEIEGILGRTARRHPRGLWKVRLCLSPDGAVRVKTSAFSSMETPWRAALSPEPVDERNVLLFHKTTDRGVYERHAALRPGVDEVLLWNRRGEITEGTRTNVVVEKKGRFFTPPVSSGLLAGVFRQKLLRQGKVRERVLRRSDLRSADRVWLVNALRGWIPTRGLSRL